MYLFKLKNHMVSEIVMATGPNRRGDWWFSRFFHGVLGLRFHIFIAAFLAAVATFFFNHRWPEHLIQVDEFIIIWIVMLFPAAIFIALWRRMVE
jgi:hypothetical protein